MAYKVIVADDFDNLMDMSIYCNSIIFDFDDQGEARDFANMMFLEHGKAVAVYPVGCDDE